MRRHVERRSATLFSAPLVLTAALVASLGCQPASGDSGAKTASASSSLEVDVLVLPNNTTVSCGAKKLIALRADGEIIWELPLPEGQEVIAPSASAANSVVYVRSSKAIQAASPEGKWLWSKPALAPAVSMPRSASAPVAMGDSSVVLLDGFAVVRLDAAGTELWRVSLPEGVPAAHLRATMDGSVLVPTTAGLYSISGDGKVAWRRKLGS